MSDVGTETTATAVGRMLQEVFRCDELRGCSHIQARQHAIVGAIRPNCFEWIFECDEVAEPRFGSDMLKLSYTPGSGHGNQDLAEKARAGTA